LDEEGDPRAAAVDMVHMVLFDEPPDLSLSLWYFVQAAFAADVSDEEMDSLAEEHFF